MRKMILGTDWWTDCDDAVALRMLARAHKRQEIRLLAVCMDACMEDTAASVDGFLRSERVLDIPLGLDHKATDYTGHLTFQMRIAAGNPDGPKNADLPDAVRLYRQILAQQTEPVEILEIGFCQVLADLLDSPPDALSPLSGTELVAQKVSKLWVMAGKWDEDGGLEHNFCLTDRSRDGGARFCSRCPVPVTFLGWEIGIDVISAAHLAKDDPLYLLMCDHGSPNGRHSWDPMLALLALTGDEEAAGYDTVQGTARVDIETGANHFTPSPDGLHRFVRCKFPPAYYADAIDRLVATNA